MSSLAYFDPEYETLSIRINPPQVSVDNSSCQKCTLVKVDSMNKPGILLEVVQILSDLDLLITKAYISSDGGWFMDVFHVTDQNGQKITDPKTIEHIEKALGPKGYMSGELKSWPVDRVGVKSMGDYNAIELIGRDRTGLLSEISAVLVNLHINVIAAEVWTHNHRIACVLYVNDALTNRAIDDASRLSLLEEQLNNILRGGGNDDIAIHTSFTVGSTHIDRRLHQLLFLDRDYEGCWSEDDYIKPEVKIERCAEKDYSVVNVKCKDRSKLMFDIVCTLTDMGYIVFHASISSSGPYALQEYYMRHKNGCILDTEAEKEMARRCLEAAIRRRVSEGLSFELCTKDRVGLLSEVTRVLRENGLSVVRAGVSTVGEDATNIFYVKDPSGRAVDAKTIEEIRRGIRETMRININVRKYPSSSLSTINDDKAKNDGGEKTSLFFWSLLEKLRG